jgi:SNF2 family DNA or RNA helicase
MLIDLENNVLMIDGARGTLKPSQASQLYFLGFQKVPGTDKYIIASQAFRETLPKLCDYLDKENVSYTLSQSCVEMLSGVKEAIRRNELIRNEAGDFKQGKYSRTEFNEFIKFVNRNIMRKLKEHQLKAAYHLYLVKNGANFSVPGSGKTAVVLTVYEKLKQEGMVNVIYVVGPAACFEPWRNEFKLTLGREPNYRILAGGKQEERRLGYYDQAAQKAELYLTSFQTLMNDQKSLITFLNERETKTFLVIDEAHYIKQIEGSWSNAVLGIAEYAKYRCVLTGTPMPRSYTDVFNLIDFLWIDSSPLDSESKLRIKIQEENHDTSSARETLKRTIGPVFYRVRKSDLGLIPPVFHQPYVIAMNRYEHQVYRAIENKIIDYTKQDYLKNIELVQRLRRGRIIRLRQCASYVRLLLTALDGYEEDLIEHESNIAKMIYEYDNLEVPAKLQFLVGLVKDLRSKKQKVVIWGNFIGTLKLIVEHLTKQGLNCKLIYGATPIERTSIDEEETRESIRAEFIDSSSGLDILVANPAACGESISLHKTCFHAIYYDLSYNCAQYLQSLDRIHRVGGSEINQANYHFLQYERTIDQDIESNLENKAKKMQEVIDEDYGVYSLNMSEEDDDIQAYERLFEGK